MGLGGRGLIYTKKGVGNSSHVRYGEWVPMMMMHLNARQKGERAAYVKGGKKGERMSGWKHDNDRQLRQAK